MKEFVRYHDLKQYNRFLTYAQLLTTIEWKEKRDEILKRDDYTCQVCKKPGSEDFLLKNKYFAIGTNTNYFIEKVDGKNILRSSPEIIFLDRKYIMQIHHKVYILNKLPWQYDNNELITLCNWCHDDYHKNNEVEVYLDQDKKILLRNLTPCYRCDGAGYIEQYSRIDNGVCYRCQGARFLEIADSKINI